MTAWEKVLDRLRAKLPGKPSRSTVLGRAGIRYGKMYWMRRYPDLRLSVVVKLAKVLKVTPGEMLDMMVKQAKVAHFGEEIEIHF